VLQQLRKWKWLGQKSRKNDDSAAKQAQQWISQVHRGPGLPGITSAFRRKECGQVSSTAGGSSTRQKCMEAGGM